MINKYRYSNFYKDTGGVDPNYFIFEVNTSDGNFTFPLAGASIYDFDYRVDGGAWVNNTSTSLTVGSLPISTDVLFEVNPKTNGIPVFKFNNAGDKDKVISVHQFGSQVWTQVDAMFYGCSNLTEVLLMDIDLSSVSSVSNMFRSCTSLTSININTADFSTISSFSLCFTGCSTLATLTADSIDTSGATNLSFFAAACPLLTGFNPSGWDVSGVTNGGNFLFNSGVPMTITDYNNTLINWAAQTVQSGVNFHFGGSQYTIATAQAARDTLTNAPNNWNITDGGGV